MSDLVAVIEPTRAATATPLHTTNIRNEHAYYCCIAQTIAEAGFVCPGTALTSLAPSTSAAAHTGAGADAGTDAGADADSTPVPLIHLCGDSHAISPAWKTVDVCGSPRLLKPELVTGLKHFHLRDETDFYPKRNFYRVVDAIPDGADVLFIFGEIDCREGILLAVEKGRYATVEEGMLTTINFFIDAVRWGDGAGAATSSLIFSASHLPTLAGPEAQKEARLPDVHSPRDPRAERDADHRHSLQSGTVQLTFIFYPWLQSPPRPFFSLVTFPFLTVLQIFEARVKEVRGLHWLDDVFPRLLTPGAQLKKEYELDGTHLHPSYVSLLGEAISRVWE